MARVGWWLAVALPALAVGCGDGGAGALLPRYERFCAEARECPGHKCVQVGPNQQQAPGICSRSCGGDAACGPGAACFLLGAAGPSCLALCDDDGACANGLTCGTIGAGGEKACFVAPPARPVDPTPEGLRGVAGTPPREDRCRGAPNCKLAESRIR